MRKTKKRRSPNAPEKRCFPVNGVWHWKPNKALRPDWQNVRLGEDFAPAMQVARNLNADADAWLLKKNAAGAPKRSIPRRQGPVTVGTLIGLYKQSANWKLLRETTRAQYVYEFKRIEAEFGHDNAATLDEARVDDWADELRLSAPQTLRHLAAKGRLLYAWAARKKHVPRGINPFVGLDLPGAGKRGTLLRGEHLGIVVAACDRAGHASLGTAWVCAFAAVQRISDVLRLKAGHIQTVGNVQRLRFTQSKGQKVGAGGRLEGGFHVDMLLPELIARRLSAAPPPATQEGWLIVREGKRPPRRSMSASGDRRVAPLSNRVPVLTWDEKEAARAWGKIRAEISASAPHLRYIEHVQLRDGRRSGFVQHVLDGATVELVCSMSGHAIEEGYAIVETYLPKTPEQADKAVGMLSTRL